MSILEILVAARAKVEKGWCQGVFARNAAGQPTLSGDPEACAWCLSGAIGPGAPYRIYELLTFVTRANNIVNWNDMPGRTQAEVLGAFDKAIELAKVIA